MASVDIKMTYFVMLDNEEMVLVLRALGGRMKGEAEAAKARDLGDRLSIQRATITRDRLKQTETLMKNLEAAGINGDLNNE
jgi:hypothetical protein